MIRIVTKGNTDRFLQTTSVGIDMLARFHYIMHVFLANCCELSTKRERGQE